MSEKDLNNIVVFPGAGISTGSDSLQGANLSDTQADLTDVQLDPTDPNFEQWCKALEACAQAQDSGLDIQRQIVIAARDLNQNTRTGQINARLAKDWQLHARRYERDEYRAIAWQIPNEKVDRAHRISESSTNGGKLVAITRGVIPIQSSTESQKLNIVGVTRGETSQTTQIPIGTNQLDQERAYSPFLKKAA